MTTTTTNYCCSGTTIWEGDRYYRHPSTGRLVEDNTAPHKKESTHTVACLRRRARDAREAREDWTAREHEHATAALASPRAAGHKAWCEVMDQPPLGDESKLDRLLRANESKQAAIAAARQRPQGSALDLDVARWP